MPYIGNTPAEKYAAFNVQHFTVSATTSYTLDRAIANELDIRLVINNVVQQPGSSYAYSAAGTTLTLTSATVSGDTMYAVYIGKAVQTVTPGTGSVGTTALADNAVTEPKLNVSNAPTNGYVLSAQSGAAGGLTWAADAAGTVTGYTNGTDNRVITSSGSTTINGEANLTYNGTFLGVGASADQGSGVHIKISDTGATANSSADELIIERSGDNGMTFLNSVSGESFINFGDSGDNDIGQMSYHHSFNRMAFKTNAVERMRIDSVGNIDTTIAGNSTAGISFKTTTDNTSSDKAYIGVHTTSNYGGNLVIARGGSNGYASETARFRNDGIVLINRESTFFGGNILQIVGNSNAEVVAIAVATNGKKAIQFANAGLSDVGNIVTSSSSVAYNTSSDYRLKENETPITDGITRLKTLKPYRFNWLADNDENGNPTQTVDGFFAHEVTAVPEAINGTKDAMHPEVLYKDEVLYTAEDELPEGMNIGDTKTPADELPKGKNFGDVKEVAKPNHQSIDQAKLVPLLVASLQEAITKIETLETKVTALENA